jgi:uncharacterized membrane protein YkgB
MGIVLVWIGALKLLNPTGFVGLVGASPFAFLAEPGVAYPFGTCEIVVGFLFLIGFRVKYLSLLTLTLFAGTLAILLLTPKVAYGDAGFPFLSLPGEFLLKDVVLMAACVALSATAQQRVDVSAQT